MLIFDFFLSAPYVELKAHAEQTDRQTDGRTRWPVMRPIIGQLR